jgi:4-hydroxy-4-methyl-2-oxoglutarate aldolase
VGRSGGGSGRTLLGLREGDEPVSVATLYEAGASSGTTIAMPAAIKPIHSSFALWGPALPVATSALDNLWIHRAVAQAEPGDVLVIGTGGYFEAGYWGEVLSRAASICGIGGVVIDGGARDAVQIAAIGVPVFSRGLCIVGTTKDARRAGSVGQPVIVGKALVERGDLIVGDADGVVTVSGPGVVETLKAAAAREAFEDEVFARLNRGESTLSIYGLD